MDPPRLYYARIGSAPRPTERYSSDFPRELEIINSRIERSVSQSGANVVARETMEHLVSMCSDRFGSKIVKKLFKRCSLPTKIDMLKVVAPLLAPIGCNCYGTSLVQE
jgi:hypothetical protein